MADRQCSAIAILAVLGFAQLATHELLSFETMDMHGMHQSNGAAMTAAHAVAVLVSAVLLAKADSALFGLFAALRALLPTVLSAPPVPDAPGRPLPRVLREDRLTAVLSRRSNARRGPPVAV
jgi:hypothetical protein